jgi:hypothetical protein
MSRTREEILEERRQLRAEYGSLFDSMAALLFRHDLARVNFEVNTGEYNYETAAILTRLHTCESAQDVQCIVREEFVRFFDADTAGPEERFKDVASEIWQLWQEYLGKKSRPMM